MITENALLKIQGSAMKSGACSAECCDRLVIPATNDGLEDGSTSVIYATAISVPDHFP